MDISQECVISKDFDFSASHRLNGLGEDHPCARLHGHNYRVRVELTGLIDAVGFVVDYGELDSFRDWINATVDHRHLNDVVTFNPTAESLARWMIENVANSVPLLSRVSLIRLGLSETPKTWAWAFAAVYQRRTR
jgi:6-pyruvoyltetrahydropterin/6-carboxytetrahydropterin synthase